MSVRAIEWAFTQKVGSAGAKAVLVALANRADEHGYGFAGQPTIAADAEMGVRTVSGHMAHLETQGFIKRVRRNRLDGTRTSDGYQLALPAKSAGSDEASTGRIRRKEQAAESAASKGQAAESAARDKRQNLRGNEPSVLSSSAPSPERVGDESEAAGARVVPLRLHADRSADDEGHADRIIQLANRGMAENPALPHSRPIPISHASRVDVLHWLRAGIPAELIERTVYNAAQKYEPDRPRAQINSMKYFGLPVERAFELQQATTTKIPDAADNDHPAERRGRAAPPRASAPPRATGTTDPRRRSGWHYE